MLALLATSICAVRRATLASGERDPETAPTVLSGLRCTPPAAADVSNLGAYVQEGSIQSVSLVMETVVLGVHDIQINDVMVVDGVAHLVVAAAAWTTIGAMHVTIERVLQ